MVKISTVIYIVVTLAFLVWFLYGLFKTNRGGDFWPGKRSGELGFACLGAIILWVIFTLIFGGIVWW